MKEWHTDGVIEEKLVLAKKRSNIIKIKVDVLLTILVTISNE
jgi:hypothetical protein